MEITAPDGTKQTITVNDRAVDMWVVEVLKRRHCNIFIDEVYDVQSRSVQHSLRQFINDSRVGFIKLPEEVRFTLAGNPPEHNPAAQGFDVGFANRIGFDKWVAPDAVEYQMHHLSTIGNKAIYRSEDYPVPSGIAAAAEKKVLEAWPSYHSKEVGLVTTYLTRNSRELHVQPEIDDEKGSRAWASHRSWDSAMRFRAGARYHGLDKSTEIRVLEGIIGEGATKGLYAWERSQDLPNAEDCLKDPNHFTHDARRPDRTLVVFNQCAALINSQTSKQTRDEMVAVFMKILRKKGVGKDGQEVPSLIESEADLCVPPVYTVLHCEVTLPGGEKRRLPLDMKNPNAVFVLARMKGAMDSAGLNYGKSTSPALSSFFMGGFAEGRAV